MVAIPWLTWIGGLIVAGLKIATDWMKRRAQWLALWFTVVLPAAFNLIRSFRLAQLAAIGAAFYAVFNIVRAARDLFLQMIYTGVSLTQILDRFTWASWLLWEGPLQLGVLWNQLLSVFTFYISVRVMAWQITRLDWFVSLVKSVLGRFP